MRAMDTQQMAAEDEAEVAQLIGRVVSAQRDDDGDSILLTYEDGRVVGLCGVGYDGLWQTVMVYPAGTEV